VLRGCWRVLSATSRCNSLTDVHLKHLYQAATQLRCLNSRRIYFETSRWWNARRIAGCKVAVGVVSAGGLLDGSIQYHGRAKATKPAESGEKEQLVDDLSIGHARCLECDPVAALPAPHTRDADLTFSLKAFTRYTTGKFLWLYIQRFSRYLHQKVPGVGCLAVVAVRYLALVRGLVHLLIETSANIHLEFDSPPMRRRLFLPSR
jgi:hypothetical protein